MICHTGRFCEGWIFLKICEEPCQNYFRGLQSPVKQKLLRWTAGLILALLNCLFGYKLRKLWGVLFGFLVGAAAGLGLAFYLKQSGKVALVAALAIGIFFALLAFLLYRLGLFFLCAGLSAFFLWQLLPFHTGPALIVYLVIGAVVGVLALAKERLTCLLYTSPSPRD